jgi:hypothetical protein
MAATQTTIDANTGQATVLPLTVGQLPAGPISFNLEATFRSPITWMVVGAVAMVFVMKWMRATNH